MAYGSSKVDNLQFNILELGNQINTLKEVRDTIYNLKERYLEYIANNFAPNWTTENGVKTVKDLNQFANVNINDFIKYFDGRISDLEVALEEVKRMNNA